MKRNQKENKEKTPKAVVVPKLGVHRIMIPSNEVLTTAASDQTTMASGKMSLKLLVDKEHNKVLFAEVGKDFVDFLINLLALPLATVVSLLKKPTMVGCISDLHISLGNLSESYMEAGQQMDTLLRSPVPIQNTNSGLLLHDIHAQLPRNKFYRFPTSCGWNITDDPNTNCTSCRCVMNVELPFLSKNRSSAGKDHLDKF